VTSNKTEPSRDVAHQLHRNAASESCAILDLGARRDDQIDQFARPLEVLAFVLQDDLVGAYGQSIGWRCL
jgi:hypothetical protein